MIYLINKKTCLSTIKQYELLFEVILNSKQAAQGILQNMIESKAMLENALNGSNVLYGILLGFGKENALGYERLYEKNMYFLKRPPFARSEAEKCVPGIDFPQFAAFDEAETKKLKKQYLANREELLKIVYREDFLEFTLSKLCQ